MDASTRGATHPTGFTLLEVVVALALSLLLMGAVYLSLDMHWKFSTAGREDMERSQLARAILRKIEVDIRSVVFQPPQSATTMSGPAAEGAEGSETATPEAAIDDGSLDAAFTQARAGIMGNRDSLLLMVSRPSRGSMHLLQDDQHLAAPRSDLRSVMYFLGVPGAQGLAGQAGNLLASGGGIMARAEVQGLVRKEGDAIEMAVADLIGDQNALLADSGLLAAEVNYLEFNYFGLGPSGLGWYDAWDSELYQMLPQAVRVTVGFKPVSGNTQVLSHTHRLVVHVPLSEPYPPEGSY